MLQPLGLCPIRTVHSRIPRVRQLQTEPEPTLAFWTEQLQPSSPAYRQCRVGTGKASLNDFPPPSLAVAWQCHDGIDPIPTAPRPSTSSLGKVPNSPIPALPSAQSVSAHVFRGERLRCPPPNIPLRPWHSSLPALCPPQRARPQALVPPRLAAISRCFGVPLSHKHGSLISKSPQETHMRRRRWWS